MTEGPKFNNATKSATPTPETNFPKEKIPNAREKLVKQFEQYKKYLQTTGEDMKDGNRVLNLYLSQSPNALEYLMVVSGVSSYTDAKARIEGAKHELEVGFLREFNNKLQELRSLGLVHKGETIQLQELTDGSRIFLVDIDTNKTDTFDPPKAVVANGVRYEVASCVRDNKTGHSLITTKAIPGVNLSKKFNVKFITPLHVDLG